MAHNIQSSEGFGSEGMPDYGTRLNAFECEEDLDVVAHLGCDHERHVFGADTRDRHQSLSVGFRKT